MTAFILVKFAHIGLSLHKLKLASKTHTHDIKGSDTRSSQLTPFTKTLSPQSWLAYWLPQLDPQYSQLCDEFL